jgi:hypothetical protein
MTAIEIDSIGSEGGDFVPMIVAGDAGDSKGFADMNGAGK